MKAAAECIPCLFRQALNTARVATSDPDAVLRVLRGVAEYAACASLDQSPAAMSCPVYHMVSRETGVADPYLETRIRTNNEALGLMPMLRELIGQAADRLDAAAHAAVAGNIIDLGIGHKFDISSDVAELMKRPFAINAIDEFRAELRPGRRILYLGDNAGEIVFDMLLVGEIQRAGAEVTYTVKSGPIINDATMEDARSVGMAGLTRVIETGGADIGVNWNNISEEFRAAVAEADCIIGKGHGNFETCEERPENFYFLLKAKCPLVAETIGCAEGDVVIARAKRKAAP